MGNDNHTIGEVSELLANAWTPSFNLEDQLRYIAYPSIYGDAEPLSVLLRVLFELDFGYEGDTFYHKCYPGSWRGWHDVHKPFAVALAHPHQTARRALELIDFRRRSADGVPFRFLDLPFEIRLRVYHCNVVGENREAQDPFHAWTHRDYGKPWSDTAALLRTNRQVYDEAEPILYQCVCFNFELDVDDGLNYFQRISNRARLNIQSISMTLGYRVHWPRNSSWDGLDNLEDWSTMCAYIAENLRLRKLTFDCFYGAVPPNFKDEEWVRSLIKIKGLNSIVQKRTHPIPHLRMYSGKDGEGDRYVTKRLIFQLDALLDYLRSEMLERCPSPHEIASWDFDGVARSRIDEYKETGWSDSGSD